MPHHIKASKNVWCYTKYSRNTSICKPALYMCFHSGFNLWDGSGFNVCLSFQCLLEGKTLYIFYHHNGFDAFFLLQQSRCIYFWAFIGNLVGVRCDIVTTMQIVVGSSPTQFAYRCLKTLNMRRARLLKFKIYNTWNAFHVLSQKPFFTPATYIHDVLPANAL